MKSRRVILFFGLALAIAQLGCSKKPDETATNPDQTAPTSESGTKTAGERSRETKKETAKPEAPKPVVVPSGTTLTVRLGSALGSKTSQTGQPFTATLVTPIAVNGETVIPEASEVAGTVVDAKSAGKFKGASNLSLRLDTITVNGTPYNIQTSDVIQGEKGKGKRSAAMIGGGAGAGALIGGLAGGGKGAAIGALVGAGAGTAGAGLTGNRDVTLPAESAVSFSLTAPVEIKRKAR